MEKTKSVTGSNKQMLLRSINYAPYERNKTIHERVCDFYDTSVSKDIVKFIKNLKNLNPADRELEIIESTYGSVEEYSLDQVLNYTINTFYDARVARDSVSECTDKSNRENTTVADLIESVEDGGTVYMAKTLSSIDKVKLAFAINDTNEVIVVDKYEVWQDLFGWSKLKELPHGSNQIREQYSDVLSDEQLLELAGPVKESEDTGSSSGYTRTEPTDEVLNLATSSSLSGRNKLSAKKIKSKLEASDDYIGGKFSKTTRIILFPKTSDKNMTDYWWIAGRYRSREYAAIANCNKGTYEYLSSVDGIMHIDEYLDNAYEYELSTTDGMLTRSDIDMSNLVLHITSDEQMQYLSDDMYLKNVKSVLADYINESSYRDIDFPDPDEMVYALIDLEDLFNILPYIKDVKSGDRQAEPVIIRSGTTVDDVNCDISVKSAFVLYGKARLPEYDWDSTELETLNNAAYKVTLEDGGYEIIQTFAKLHDSGQPLYSESPAARWMQ